MINFQAVATILYVVDGRIVNDCFPSFAVAMRNLRHYPGGVVVPMAITDENTVRYEDFTATPVAADNSAEADMEDWQIELLADHEANMAALREQLSA